MKLKAIKVNVTYRATKEEEEARFQRMAHALRVVANTPTYTYTYNYHEYAVTYDNNYVLTTSTRTRT